MGGKGTIIAYGSGILEKYGSLICGLFFFKLPKLPNCQIANFIYFILMPVLHSTNLIFTTGLWGLAQHAPTSTHH